PYLSRGIPLSSYTVTRLVSLFSFNDTSPTAIYTLSLHDALPISPLPSGERVRVRGTCGSYGRSVHLRFLAALLHRNRGNVPEGIDRKSTRLNSSHVKISYAVFCLKKKKKTEMMLNYVSTNLPST